MVLVVDMALRLGVVLDWGVRSYRWIMEDILRFSHEQSFFLWIPLRKSNTIGHPPLTSAISQILISTGYALKMCLKDALEVAQKQHILCSGGERRRGPKEHGRKECPKLCRFDDSMPCLAWNKCCFFFTLVTCRDLPMKNGTISDPIFNIKEMASDSEHPPFASMFLSHSNHGFSWSFQRLMPAFLGMGWRLATGGGERRGSMFERLPGDLDRWCDRWIVIVFCDVSIIEMTRWGH